MDAFWMETPWWQFPIGAAVFAFFPLGFWFLGTALLVLREEAAAKNRGKLEHSDHNRKDINGPLRCSSPSPACRAGRIRRGIEIGIMPERLLSERFGVACVPKGIAIILAMGLFLWLEMDLWVGVSKDIVTLEQAVLVQVYLFLPFLMCCFVGAYYSHQWYLYKLAKWRKDQEQN